MGSAAAVAACVGAVWLAFWSPLLNVREIKVIGAQHVDAADVAAVAGLGDDDNLLLVSPPHVADKVEKLPWVRDAKVDRKLPGTVRVRVSERAPAIVLSLAGEQWTLDRRGNVLADGSVGEGLPVLTAVDPGEVAPGTRIADDTVRDALAAWRSLSRRLRRQVAAIVAPGPERITLSLSDGTQVRFGAARALRAKNEVLGALLTEMRKGGESASYIDVRVPANPAVSARAPAAAPTPAPTHSL